MNAETLALVKDVLSKVGALGDRAWDIALRQVWVEIGMDVILLIGTTYGMVRLWQWAIALEKREREIGGIVLAAFLSLVYACLAGFALWEIMTGLVNPEYLAVKILMGLVKSGG